MMIRDIFEIESKQKYIFFTVASLFAISFLQLFIFQNNIFKGNIWLPILLSISLGIIWFIGYLPSALLFYSITKSKKDKLDGFVWIILGAFMTIITAIITYIGFELNLPTIWFVRLSILILFLLFSLMALIKVIR